MRHWEVVIGLEIHAQISSETKLFSRAPTQFGADPNTQVELLDLGFPGILPVINHYCVDQGIKASLGLKGQIHYLSIFDRKNYFYADLPTGYQISQFHKPLMTDGYLDIELDETKKRIRINRLHLEQDAGKSIHDIDPYTSYIDLNRCGIALMEIVSEPDLRSAQEAMAYVKKLRTLLRYLGTCDGNMEEGSLRVDVNISVRRPGEPLGTRAEVKNVNSIRFVGQAIDYEVERQIEILENGGTIVQETRLFDAQKCATRSMRSKEDAHDYRYFPDPDLPPLKLSRERVETIQNNLCELPDDKINRFVESLGLSSYDAKILVEEKDISDYYESVLKMMKDTSASAPKILANWLIGEVFGFMNKENVSLSDLPFSKQQLADLMDVMLQGVISGKIAKTVFSHMVKERKNPKDLIKEMGLQQLSDPTQIDIGIDEILKNYPEQIKAYQNGKQQLFGFFVGEAMKKFQGKANPTLVNDILKKKLSKE
jgi:aspartyl-tRNA(Asn)/glutamyl-tRNA(Gln) amidotransferase subunit B